jgi:hypothetical protein
MCPLSVAGALSGRYCWTALAVSPGHVVNWLFVIALRSVRFGGLKRHWCRYFINDSFDFIVYALAATLLVAESARLGATVLVI